MNVFVLLNTKEEIQNNLGNRAVLGHHWLSIFVPTMEVNGAPKQPAYKLSSEYLPLCSAEQRKSNRFGTTWGWVNDDRIFIFGSSIPLSFRFSMLITLWPSITTATAGRRPVQALKELEALYYSEEKRKFSFCLHWIVILHQVAQRSFIL